MKEKMLDTKYYEFGRACLDRTDSGWYDELTLTDSSYVATMSTYFRNYIADWSVDQWKECLMNGTDNMRIECCLDQNDRIRYFRSFNVIPMEFISIQKLQNNLQKRRKLSDGLITSIMLDLIVLKQSPLVELHGETRNKESQQAGTQSGSKVRWCITRSRW